ncbi:MAG: hypothetical protein JW841_05375 [Deltaproteobacteria bacterium]|nr:hypothetical protein [Deltaproteobacteria bacterium]
MIVLQPLAKCLALIMLLISCDNTPPMTKAEIVPEKQFIFEGVRIEEHEAAKLVWVGMAERSTGDINNADAQGVHIRHFSKSDSVNASDQVFEIYGIRGQIGFEERKATLEDVRIETPRNGVLSGGNAVYNGKTERVQLDGPLIFKAPGLNVSAKQGEMILSDNVINVTGPVIGRYEWNPN